MARFALLIALVCLLSPLAFAQADTAPKAKPEADRKPVITVDRWNTAVETTANGIFLVHAGILVKFDPKTLQQQGMVELFGPMPPMPVAAEGADPDRQAFAKWMQERTRRMSQPVMIVDGEALVVVVAEKYLRLNQKTLTIDAQADLRAPDAPAGRPLMGVISIVELNGDSVYVIQGGEIINVHRVTGKLQGRITLPEELAMPSMYQPRPAPRNPDPATRPK